MSDEKNSPLEIVRKAILEEMGALIATCKSCCWISPDSKEYVCPKCCGTSCDSKRAWEIIVESTTTGEEDRGQWAPHAAVIIYTENGIPSGLYTGDGSFESWFNVNERIGYDRFLVEHYNSAVIAVYDEWNL